MVSAQVHKDGFCLVLQLIRKDLRLPQGSIQSTGKKENRIRNKKNLFLIYSVYRNYSGICRKNIPKD